jgi:hypothetical protein
LGHSVRLYIPTLLDKGWLKSTPIASALLTLAGVTMHGLGTAGTFWTSPIVLLFLAGMSICVARHYALPGTSWRWSGLAALAVLLVEVPVAVHLAGVASPWLPASLAAAAIGAVALVTLCPGPSGGSIVRWGEFLGDASYSLYLAHPFAIIVAAQIWMRVVPVLADRLRSGDRRRRAGRRHRLLRADRASTDACPQETVGLTLSPENGLVRANRQRDVPRRYPAHFAQHYRSFRSETRIERLQSL